MQKIQELKEKNFTYDNLKRFISYYYQAKSLIEIGEKNILEIGIGYKTLSDYLIRRGFNVETCDNCENLEPDMLADAKLLPYVNNSFDVVAAFQVLEHMEYKDAQRALSEFCRVTKKYVVISVPHSDLFFEVIIKFPLIMTFFKKDFFRLKFCLPFSTKIKESENNHFWEIGRKNYSLRNFKKKLEDKYNIKKEFRPIVNSSHHFFILEKINAK